MLQQWYQILVDHKSRKSLIALEERIQSLPTLASLDMVETLSLCMASSLEDIGVILVFKRKKNSKSTSSV